MALLWTRQEERPGAQWQEEFLDKAYLDYFAKKWVKKTSKTVIH